MRKLTFLLSVLLLSCKILTAQYSCNATGEDGLLAVSSVNFSQSSFWDDGNPASKGNTGMTLAGPRGRSTFIPLMLTSMQDHPETVTVGFNFSSASQPVSGWINVAGDPYAAVRTATDATSGISISSVSTANWLPWSGGIGKQ